MADITSNLFPEVGSLFRLQDMQAGANAVNMAQLGYANAALAAGSRGASMAASRLGRTVGGLLGATTPEQDEAAATKAIADELVQQGVDLQSGNGMMQMAQRLMQKKLYNAAQKATAAANILKEKEATIQKTQAETGFKQAETQRNIAETTKINTGLANEVIAKKTAKAALEAQGVDPVQIEGILNNPKALESYLKLVDEKTQTVEADGRVKLISKVDGKVIADLGVAPKRGTSVSIDTRAEGKFLEGLAAVDVKRVENAITAKTAAISELGSLEKMSKLNEADVFSGTMASGRVGVANFFNTIGLVSKADSAKLANSEQFQKISGDLILSKIKALGTNPSNADREFIANIIPRLENSAAARKQLIDYLAQKARDVINEADRMDSYARKNKGLSGFQPKVPFASETPPESSKTLDEMTNEELIAAYRKKKGQ